MGGSLDFTSYLVADVIDYDHPFSQILQQNRRKIRLFIVPIRCIVEILVTISRMIT